jgi:small GTP-binding protein
MKDEVAILTAQGAAAIAVVRIVGPGVESLLTRHFSRQAKPARAVHGELRDGETLIDDPVVVLSQDGLFADINLHGGPWVVEAMLRLAERNGFVRVASTPPLPLISVDADSVIEQEILQYLPLAKTELALRVLLSQREAWKGFDKLAASLVNDLVNDRSLHFLLHPPTVAIVGIPNAGKSTLANQLFAQERSITADLPGTTRDWVGEMANIDGLAVRLIDTPGVRETNDFIEREAIARSLAVIASSELVIVLLDVTQAMEPQRMLLDRYPGALVLANKIDRDRSWNEMPAILIAANTGEGLDEVRSEIKRFFGCEEMNLQQPRCWTERQRALHRARQNG